MNERPKGHGRSGKVERAGGRHQSAIGRLGTKMAWVLLVVVVPLLATLVMVGAVLQLVFHVPAWQKAERWFGITRQPPTRPAVSQTVRNLTRERRRNAMLSSQVSSLTVQVSAEQMAEQRLRQQVRALQRELASVKQSQQQFKAEATVLTAMDASTAAQVVAQLSQADAASCLAQMAPSDAAQILAAMPPVQSGRLLPLVAKAKVSTVH